MTALTQTSSRIPDLSARSLQAALYGMCDVWMIDHCGSTVLSCRCVECSAGQMRLRVPSGYGVAMGQRYELCAHPLGGPQALSGLRDRRWATVERIRPSSDEADDHLEISVALEPGERALEHDVDVATSQAIRGLRLSGTKEAEA